MLLWIAFYVALSLSTSVPLYFMLRVPPLRVYAPTVLLDTPDMTFDTRGLV